MSHNVQHQIAAIMRRRGGFSFGTALRLLEPYSPRLAYNFIDPANSLFQGTTLATVTSATNPVGVVIDQTQGGLANLGAELVTNGGPFANTTGWTAQAGNTISASGGELVNTLASSPSGSSQVITTVSGRWYRVTCDIRVGTSTSASVRMFDTAVGGTSLGNSTTVTSSTSVTVSLVFRAISTASAIYLRSEGVGTSFFNNISVREIPGNHATASSDAKRPLFARYPATGRRNLLTYTEDFSNAAWTKNNATVLADVVANPLNGELTADRMTTSASFGEVRASAFQVTGNHTLTCYVKNESLVEILLRLDRTGNTANMTFTFATEAVVTSGANVISASATNLGGGWHRLRVTGNVTSTGWLAGITAGSATGAAIIWGAQIELGSTATNYQRVVTSADITEAGVRDVYASMFDGADDCLQVSGFDLSNTDEVTVIAGVRKLSDAAGGVLCELSANSSGGNGRFGIFAPGNVVPPLTDKYATILRGSSGNSNVRDWVVQPTPSTIFTVFTFDNALPTGSKIRAIFNGTLQASTNSNGIDSGTGNFTNDTLFIGQRAGSSLPFNGYLHYLFICGAIVPDSILTQIYRGLGPRIGLIL